MNKLERRRNFYTKQRRALKIIKHSWGHTGDHLEWLANRLTDNLKACSCWACGNPRKYFNQRTIQEQKFLERMSQEIQDAELEMAEEKF